MADQISLVVQHARPIVLMVAGIAALAYALWPPAIEAPYLALAGGLLGFDPVIRSAK